MKDNHNLYTLSYQSYHIICTSLNPFEETAPPLQIFLLFWFFCFFPLFMSLMFVIALFMTPLECPVFCKYAFPLLVRRCLKFEGITTCKNGILMHKMSKNHTLYRKCRFLTIMYMYSQMNAATNMFVQRIPHSLRPKQFKCLDLLVLGWILIQPCSLGVFTINVQIIVENYFSGTNVTF